MKYCRLGVLAVAVAGTLSFAAIAPATSSEPHLAAHTVTVQIRGLPRECSVTAWEYFTLPPNGHQPWRFTMHYGGGTSCAGGGGLKFLTVEVDRKVGRRWQVLDNPVTNRIAQPTRGNPLRISASWTAVPSTPTGTANSPVTYRVIANATISLAKHPSIPPQIVKGVTASGSALTPAAAP
jgi:hypothetical protein